MADPLDDLIDAAALALDLPIEPSWKAAVNGTGCGGITPALARLD